jgi:hypothetical protein
MLKWLPVMEHIMQILEDETPGAGAYLIEANFVHPDW